MNILLNGTAVGWAIIGLIALIAILIYWFRVKFSKISQNKQFSKEKTTILSRNKYAEVNAFKWRNTFLKVGMIMSLGFVVLAFNWTTFEKAKTNNEVIEIEDIIDNEVPRTIDLPKPPPPLPPPPVKIEIPDEPVEDEPLFIDQSIDAPYFEMFINIRGVLFFTNLCTSIPLHLITSSPYSKTLPIQLSIFRRRNFHYFLNCR